MDDQSVGETYLDRVPGLSEDAKSSAGARCGQSDVLYEKLVHEAYGSILDSAPEQERDATEAMMKARGFQADLVPYVSQDGECELTGIEVDCCQCGRHE